MTKAGATIEVFSGKTSDGPTTIGTVVLCTRDQLNAATAMSMWTTDYRWLQPGEAVERLIIQGSILTLQRNEALKRMEGDWIIFIDDDMIWQPGDVGRLVDTWKALVAETGDNAAICGGLCHRRGAPYDPTLYVSDQKGGYRYLETWDRDIVAVDATGMAFVLIPLAAIERITGIAWPEVTKRKDLPPPPVFRWDGVLGEDLQFYRQARLKGIKVYVDTRIEIGHIGELIINRDTFLREMTRRTPEQEEAERALNEPLGLPTMTAEQAKKELGWA